VNTFRALDDMLLDKVFQPLCAITSKFTWARRSVEASAAAFVLWSGVVALNHLSSGLYGFVAVHAVGLLILLAVHAVFHRSIGREERAQRETEARGGEAAAPQKRLTMLSGRMALILYSAFQLWLLSREPSLAAALAPAWSVATMSACYFLACVDRPPGRLVHSGRPALVRASRMSR